MEPCTGQPTCVCWACEQNRTLTTLRAENERLREALRDLLRTHGGVHGEGCDAEGWPDNDGPPCACGALAIRDSARAALKEGT